MKQREKKMAICREYENTVNLYVDKGYRIAVHTISFVKAFVTGSIISLVFAIPCIVVFEKTCGHMFFSVLNIDIVENPELWLLDLLSNLFVFIALFIVCIVIHEVLHAVGFMIFSALKWKNNISFGVEWSKCAAYCHVSRPITMGRAVFATLLPIFILGFGMYAIALAVGSGLLCLLATTNILCGCGDLIYVAYLVRYRSELILDNPDSIGFTALYKEK